ncbi:hypothetical protein [Micromonospora sp. NPDC005291]|uniref:hypothetical protein n=1 Tax=Micromonospora sp. NPDC005291 TaxID=3156872 RepID=UPI0033A398E8
MTRQPAGPRIEGVALVLILLTVAGFAGAASFTHVKDWTLANSPTGTGEWFGWANAVISELVPVAALLTIRRRQRVGASITYPMLLLIGSAGLSLAAQLAVAKPGPSGWLLSAVPALAFMALVKLVLAPATTRTAEITSVTPPAVDTPPASEPVVDTPQAPTPAIVQAPAFTPISVARPEVPAHLMPTARFVIGRHEQSTGRPITTDELGGLLSVTPDIARELLHTITGHTPAVNGTPVGGTR